MSIADKYRPQFTYEEYLLWEGRWELIDGMPYAMSPAPTPNHQQINGRLWALFNTALQLDCNMCEAYLPIDWKINENTVVQPDLLIVCKPIEKKYLDFEPSLIVEILSPGTAHKDRNEKFELYQHAGVQYYIIVDPIFKKTEVYELIKEKYQPIAVSPNEITFSAKDSCKFTTALNSIWD